MEIARLIQDRLDALVAAQRGRRVGVYPADHGRFADDLSRRLAGLEVVGIHHGRDGFRDQGFRAIPDPEAFLDAVDVALMWGVDDAAADLLYRALRRPRPPAFINVLDPDSPSGLLTPRTPLRFADFHEAGDQDRAELGAAGLDSGHLARGFSRGDDDERAWARELGVPGRTARFDNIFLPLDTTLLECGKAFCPCPVCGRTLVSDQAFLLRQPELHFVTAHRFVCHEEFYLFKTMPIIIGLYLPARELFVSAQPRSMDMRYMFYEERELRGLIGRFRLLCLRRLDGVREYARPVPKKRLALCGNWVNFGHHVRNELGGIQALLDAGLPEIFADSLITLSDIFEVETLFPELPGPRRLPPGDIHRQAFEAFRIPVDHGLLPVMIHYGGPFQESLARKVFAMAEQRCRTFALELAAAVRRHCPVVWVTLRSTRAWISQNEGFIRLLGRLHARFPTLAVVFDGLDEERGRMREIMAGLPRQLPVFDALCLNRFETIHLARHIDVHVSPLGSGATFMGIVNKPGVFHGGKDICDSYLLPAGEGSCASLPRENPALNLAVRAVREDRDVEKHVRQYELDPDELFEAVRTVLVRHGFPES